MFSFCFDFLVLFFFFVGLGLFSGGLLRCLFFSVYFVLFLLLLCDVSVFVFFCFCVSEWVWFWFGVFFGLRFGIFWWMVGFLFVCCCVCVVCFVWLLVVLGSVCYCVLDFFCRNLCCFVWAVVVGMFFVGFFFVLFCFVLFGVGLCLWLVLLFFTA